MTSNHRGPAGEHQHFDAQWWEQHYRDAVAGGGQPGAHLLAELTGVRPGTALDAGCGTGAGASWLARQGWDVTAVDVSPTAVQRARTLAADLSISWLVADLNTWQPPRQYDLVLSQYVHPALPFGDFVGRLGRAVAPGGMLLVVGHDHTDRHSAAHAPRPASIGADLVLGALEPGQWEVAVAETRQVTRSDRPAAADLVVRAHRKLDADQADQADQADEAN